MEGRPWCHTQETDDGKTRMTARERTARLRLKHRGELVARRRGERGGGRAVGVTGESGHCPGTHVHLPTEEQRAFICILESLLRLLFKEPMTAEQVYGGGVGGSLHRVRPPPCHLSTLGAALGRLLPDH